MKPSWGVKPVDVQFRLGFTSTRRTEPSMAPWHRALIPVLGVSSCGEMLNKLKLISNTFWLVVWKFGTWLFIFPYIGNDNPKWLIFFRGVETTKQRSKETVQQILGGCNWVLSGGDSSNRLAHSITSNCSVVTCYISHLGIMYAWHILLMGHTVLNQSVDSHPSEKYEFVSWDDYHSRYMEK